MDSQNMTSPIRKSKRKLEEAEAAAAEANANMAVHTADPMAVDPSVEQQADSEDVKPPIIKKPRKDIADAALLAAAAEGSEKTEANPAEGGGVAAAVAKEEAKEGETKVDIPQPVRDEATKEMVDAGTPQQEEKTAETHPGAPDAKQPEEAAVKKEDTAMAVNAAMAAAQGAARLPNVPTQPAPPPAPIYKEEDYEEPDDGAEIPEDPEHIWNARLVELLLYKHQYRTLHVQATYDQSLHAWVDIQRKLYRRHRKDAKSVSALTQTRLTALDAINFPFTLRGAAHWDRYFAKLQDFAKKHGHCLVPRLCEFPGLGDWVIDQRRQYKLMMQGKPSVLDPERQRKLEEMGFVWVVRNRPEWNNRYQELIQYREKYGDTKVPQHYKEIPGLGKWVAKQREQYRLLQQGKHSFLTPDRLERLNDAGFVWSVRKDGAEDMAALATKKKSAAAKKEEEAKVEVKAEVEHPGKPKEDAVLEAALDAAAEKVNKEEEVKQGEAKNNDGNAESVQV